MVRTPVGDRYVLERMLNGATISRRASGHIILSTYAHG